VVLAPTRFVADAVHASDPSINVMPFPQTVDVPEGIESQRARFALPEDATIFGMSFAAQAVIERKNPWAAIEAFRLAFPTEADVRLVVRAYDAGGADASPTLRRLRDAAADDPRILIDGERLAYEDVVALYASCDAYVSLHRSEGLGLGPMEAMTVGTPVVATNWSGVLDFMTEYNSCLVDYELVPVDVDPTSPYSSDSIGFDECWAEPDVDDAARLMCKLYCEPEWRRELGRRAMHDMRERHQRIESAPFIDDLISLAGRVDDPSQGHGTRARSLERLQNEMINERRIIAFKRAVVRVLRALRLKPPAPESELRD
jgi:glycosyltransferase involved in cell wall biosynthesis